MLSTLQAGEAYGTVFFRVCLSDWLLNLVISYYSEEKREEGVL